MRLGREKPVDHRSRAHAQPPTPPASARGSPSFRTPGPRGGGNRTAAQLGTEQAVGGYTVRLLLQTRVRAHGECVCGGCAVTSHLTLRLRRLRSHSAKRSLTARPLLARCRHESPMGSTETEQYAEAVS